MLYPFCCILLLCPCCFSLGKKKKKGTICLGKQRKKLGWFTVEEVKIPTSSFTFCFNSYLYHYLIMSFINYTPHVMKFLDYCNGKTVSVGTFRPSRSQQPLLDQVTTRVDAQGLCCSSTNALFGCIIYKVL